MALTLRDSHSYETQIIDAVRGVNRALGGTYGTSSAIHKSEFNQYEVQLIDAIKGIGRTLSGNGLSLAGGGASSKELQDLAKRVTKLESESFFRLVAGNVTLKEQYQNLWVPGWLAAGGIGTGGGGGGGATVLNDLEDVTIDTSTLANGDVLAWDPTAGTAGLWVNKPGGGGSYTLPIASSSTLGGIKVGNGLAIDASTGVLSVTGASINGYIGTTQVQSTAAAQDLTGISSVKLSSSSSLFEWDNSNSAWHFYGNIYSDGWIAAGGTGTPGGGGGGADLSDVWNSLTNTVADQWATTKIDLAHIPNITASMVSDLGTWASSNLYTLRTHVSTTAANGTLLGVDALSNASTSVSGSDSTRIEWDNDHNAWRVRGNLYADGWVAAGGIGSGGGGGGATSLSGLSDVNDSLSPAAKNVLWYDSTNSIWDAHALTLGDISNVSLSSLVDGQYLAWDATNQRWGNASPLLRTLLDVDVTPSSAYDGYVLTYQNSGMKFVLTPGGGGGGSSVSWGTTYSDYTVDLTVDGVTKNICLDGYNSGGGGGSSTLAGLSDVTISSPTSGQILKYNGSKWVNGSAGGGSATALTDLSDVSLSGLTDGQALVWDATNAVWKNATVGGGGGGGYIGTTAVQSSSQAQALTGILSVNATSSSSSLSRMVWDSSNSAWHFYGNIYADGWIAAGGVGSSDPGFVKFVQLTQTQYNNLASKDSGTIYYATAPGTAKVYLGSVQLSN